MPELPEVETARRGILPAVAGHRVDRLTVYESRLRWPVPAELADLSGLKIETIDRRGKYLLFRTTTGTALVHLGMSGSLRLVKPDEPRRLHDHIELLLDSGWLLRFHDPRRFGCFLWLTTPPEQHSLLADLGPEPLENDFDGAYLLNRSRGRQVPVKSFLMDSHVVVGVGNIYANEALFKAGIHPLRAAGRISAGRYRQLALEIKQVLAYAIERGGTTLRDFVNGHGEPGYFQLELDVYGRSGEACKRCKTPLLEARLGGRSTVYCPRCQK
ncbi:MAG: bifunctional DNA-formamidopyrimidine glycosylase/DNA-(apurinic or apyrimidinic site) lyase [Moraxellaceae bacterium]|jgi:formamidopyrimidine-DNA glycosylase|nr:bifunctional DNA-formamidopyrimidine glycosylase/DNA-(apurinic or apyrimidinic site) lyase [Moraxellaceae bacterium]